MIKHMGTHSDGTTIVGSFDLGSLDEGIFNLSKTAEGNYYACDCRFVVEIADEHGSDRHMADEINCHCYSTGGMRFAYGLLPEGAGVVEVYKVGRFNTKDVKAMRDRLGLTKVWHSTFSGKMWIVDGREAATSRSVDASFVETTRLALAYRGLL